MKSIPSIQKYKLLFGIVSLLLMVLACGNNPHYVTISPIASPIPPTATPENSPTPDITRTYTPSPTDTLLATPEMGILPGLQPVDVTINLEDRQFTCDLVYRPSVSDPNYKWECKSESAQYYMLVEIWSKSLFTVDLIQSSIMQFGTPDDELAANFLGFMATMPYDGADPQNARNWVEGTLPTIKTSGDVRDATFGGITFLLYGIPSSRFLEFGEVTQ